MTFSQSDRISVLFRERDKILEEVYKARSKSGSLTQEHNKLVQEAEQAGRADGSRQRKQLKAQQKAEELKKARSHEEQISRDLSQKEREIADLIAALWAASRLALSGDGAIRQVNTDLAEINQRLKHIDDGIGTITPTITGLQRFTESAAAHRGSETRELESAMGAPVTRLGWQDMAGTTGPRSPLLPDEAVSSLPAGVTVLLFASEPHDQERIDLGAEIREIMLAIERTEYRDRITLQPWLATEPLDLIPNINKHQPHMIQFSGHGSPDGLLMMGPPNRSQPLSADRLIQMLKWSAENLRIVFFNFCDSEEHARAAAQVVDGAIGMRGDMHDAPARKFAASLYSGLAYGRSLKHAFYQACAGIGDQPDRAIPQLFFRAGIDPHTIVLARPGPDDS